ncbi:ABC transporter permease [Kurthia sibirica]|nr:ABC-2 family transporter protein [Kurthia sibirica]GEK35464.1 ABC transporter permease [Kurthia sibirica]
MQGFKQELNFLTHVWKLNFLSAMEYRVNFIIQIVMMILNNALYFIFWIIFFETFTAVNGWDLSNMLLLFSIVTTGAGIAFIFFGNATRLSSLIEDGQMDYYITLPKNPLFYSISSRTSISAVGDVIFGVFIFFFLIEFNAHKLILWVICSILVAAILTAYVSILGTMAFWTGRAQVLSEQGINAIMTFAMYPSSIFNGYTRLILFTVIPAGFISEVPVSLLNEPNLISLSILCVFTVIICSFSYWLFGRGLKNYESGNLLNINM